MYEEMLRLSFFAFFLLKNWHILGEGASLREMLPCLRRCCNIFSMPLCFGNLLYASELPNRKKCSHIYEYSAMFFEGNILPCLGIC